MKLYELGVKGIKESVKQYNGFIEKNRKAHPVFYIDAVTGVVSCNKRELKPEDDVGWVINLCEWYKEYHKGKELEVNEIALAEAAREVRTEYIRKYGIEKGRYVKGL